MRVPSYARSAVCALLLLTACATDLRHDELPGDDGGTASRDSGATPDDAGTPDDAQTPDDAAATEDAGPITDPTDAGTIIDASAPPPPPPPPCPYRGRTYRLRHLQASMQRTDTLAQRNASIDAAFNATGYTISWTEIENLSDARRIQARAGWDTFWPSGRAEVAAKNAVPISWRSDTFRLVRGQSWLASSGLAGVSPSRFVTRVWLTHIPTGLVQSRVAHHSVSGVDGAGSDPVEWRRRAHAQNIAKFRDVMRLGIVPVVGSGDFNTVRLRGLLGTTFRYDVPASGGSHGSRLIDWVVRVPHPELRFVSARFITNGYSDHRGVRVAYDYAPRCP